MSFLKICKSETLNSEHLIHVLHQHFGRFTFLLAQLKINHRPHNDERSANMVE
jgi:hypothetical protein